MISEGINKKMRDLELENRISEDEDKAMSDLEDDINGFTATETLATARVLGNDYILSLSATRETDPTLAAGLSREKCLIYKLSNGQIAETCSLGELNQDSIVIDCKFSEADNNFLYSGTVEGIYLWDLRTPKNPSVSFRDTTVYPKPLTCFDVSCNNRLISAGSNVFEGDAFILFWDIRKASLLGGYWESHTDDITQVKFCPDDMNKLISGSVDGLINVYDLAMACEDDALNDTLNTESSIERLSWFTRGIKEGISCITHTADLQLWDIDGAEPSKKLSRKEIAEIVKVKNDLLYVANCHQRQNSQVILVGSNHKNGECLRAAALKENSVSTVWDLKNNTQRVRCSFFDENTNMLFSGGENGVLNVWKLNEPK